MSAEHKYRLGRNRVVRLLPLMLVMLSLACALPALGRPTPTQPAPTSTPTIPPLPTPTPQPLPPDLVESSPPQSVEVPLEGPITLYFNQPMDRPSVEAALSLQFEQEISFTWIDDSTVVLYLATPLEPETQLSINLSEQVRSAQGKPLLQPISLSFQSAGYLRLAQTLPEKDTADVDPSSAVVASFNRPIVPLGADPASLAPAFSLEPAAEGRGEWLNTSTYIFYPEPPLEGGKRYMVNIDSGLKSTDGGPLKDASSWSFTTAMPRLLSIEPITEMPWRLDAEVRLTFNQPMDQASVEANFSLTGPDGNPVPGKAAWDEDAAVFTFTPDNLLARNATYTLNLNGQAQARGGTSLGDSLNASVITVPELAVYRSEPAQGESVDPNMGVALYFSAPIQDKDALEYVRFEPIVSNLSRWWDAEAQALRLSGSFYPSTAYTLTVSASLPDAWGGTMGQDYLLGFQTTPLQPGITVNTTGQAIFLTPEDPSLVVQAVNVPQIPLAVGSVPLSDFFTMLGPEGYDFQRNYQSADQRSWEQSVEVVSDRNQPVELYLTPDRSPLNPGMYFMRFNFTDDRIYNGPFIIVVSNIQTTLKVSATDALVWAVDLRSDLPLANAPVTIFAENGQPLASGATDVEGVFKATFEPIENPYSQVYAVISQPGDDSFGMAISSWSMGVDSWDFGISSNPQPPGLRAYIYTDRPIYRPGQTVYFRVVLRQAYNGRYTLPDIGKLPITIYGFEGQELTSFDLALSALGTAHGEYTLPDGAQPGYYSIGSSAVPNYYLGFQVANYRKPEINLQVNFAEDQVLAGERLNASVNARYFFDAPAGNLPVHWALYKANSDFSLPGYKVGPEDTRWLEAYSYPIFAGGLGDLVSEGDAQTRPDGTLALDFPTEPGDARQRYSLEVTTQDESGLPVSARDSLEANPDEFYIGLRSDAWVGRAGEQSGFEVQVVDWLQAPAGERNLRAEFQKVVWVREDPPSSDPYGLPKYTPQYTPVGSTDFVTNLEGKARLAFTPTEPGTYQVDVYNLQAAKGKGARTQLLLWVGGPGEAIWPNLPNSRLRITADKDAYRPGDTAQVFIPNPYGVDVPALVTVERSIVMDHQVLELPADGLVYSLPLGTEQAPNVYLSVTLVGRDDRGIPDFRQGYLNLPVEPVEQTLNVQLTGQPDRAGPGDEVRFEIQVSDSSGNPVQGEFSLAVIDLAALALADPNSPDIVSAFYSEQPLGVRTGQALAAYNRRSLFIPGGMGGGGGQEAPSVVREEFPDTAYWNAEVVTSSDGRAQVAVTLPDTLTTWQVDTRGLTEDTRVGQSEMQVVTTKDLLVRPVSPRFAVVDDHLQLVAIVQNNGSSDIQVEVTLQADGFLLDDPALQTQPARVPAQGRARVEWWGTVQDVPSLDLVFSAQGVDASGAQQQDAARPPLGILPVLRFIAPQTFRTSGALDVGGEIQELVSLPRSYDPESGELDLELAPSLAAAMMKSLDALEAYPYESTEQILSSFLPNLETYRTLQDYGIEDVSLKSRLDRTLNQGLQRLQARQNQDGGWGWWQGGESDSYMTAYVLFGLSRARQAGVAIDVDVIQKAVDFLKSSQTAPEAQISQESESWQLDRLVFAQYALAQVGEAQADESSALYQIKSKLSPWSQALLALNLESFSPGSEEARTLLSDLQASATRSATGAHWEMSQNEAGNLAALLNMHTTLSNSAVVVYALAQRDPGTPLVSDAVRYLMASRDAGGSWFSTYTTAWTLIALDEVIKGTGELGGDFSFAAKVNNNLVAEGQAGGTEQLTPVTAQLQAQRLYAEYPNALTIQRDEGPGRLYYTAALKVSRPVEQVTPLSQGLSIERLFYPFGEACPEGKCEPIQSAKAGEKVTVRLTLTLPQDVYYLVVEDYIPAGAEILDTSLKTSQVGEGGEAQTETVYDPRRPYASGWGWWLFNPSQIYDDHIAWTADYLPAGTYELTYTLVILQAGEYRVLPPRAWQLYFPEVQANGSGAVFEIKP